MNELLFDDDSVLAFLMKALAGLEAATMLLSIAALGYVGVKYLAKKEAERAAPVA